MTIKVFMSQLWPDAGGRTRAVFVRNESIYQNISKDTELYVLHRADDLQERIINGTKRFKNEFQIKALFQDIRHLSTFRPQSRVTNNDIVSEHVVDYQNVRFETSADGKMITAFRNNEKIMKFWKNASMAAFTNSSNTRDKMYYLTQNAKVVHGFKNGTKSFRLVNDLEGNMISLGRYLESPDRYSSEQFFNIYGEKLFESAVQGGKQRYYTYLDDTESGLNITSEKELVEYLVKNYVNVENDDTLIIDEPQFYTLGLALGNENTQRLFYFHWYNYGEQEKLMLTDNTVNKTAVFLTEKQRNDFVTRANGFDNPTLTSIVTDNVLEPTDQVVKRSTDGVERILFIGRLSREKNIPRTFRAFAEYLKINNKAVLTLIGDGAERANLEKLANELGIRESVDFVGNLRFPYESKYVETVDFAMITPIGETYGLVFPEFISRGIPVVTVDSSFGPSNWIVNDKNGKILDVEASDAEIAQAMHELSELNLKPEDVMSTLDIEQINKDVDETLINLISK